MGKIVWVLGTGFSVPLGGPMLKDLLSLRLHHEVEKRYHAEELGSGAMVDLLWLYHFGREFPEGREIFNFTAPAPGEQLWDHAEDFLDALDTCAANPEEPFGEHLRMILRRYYVGRPNEQPTTLPELVTAAKRHIAAECCSFLERHADASERWGPYRRWVRDLGQPQDAIVTFNYDCVPEKLIERKARMHVVTGFDPLEQEDGAAPVYKLQGSTSWRGTKTKDTAGGREVLRVQEGSMTEALTCSADELVIASPGPSKARAAKLLGRWWSAATEALKVADAVVFIGYRFPPSDSDARSELSGALAENSRPAINLHTVLGPRLDDDVARLEQMLRFAMRSPDRADGYQTNRSPRFYFVAVHRLYSQDFMSLVTRDALLPKE